jgi:hypothetical protein
MSFDWDKHTRRTQRNGQLAHHLERASKVDRTIFKVKSSSPEFHGKIVYSDHRETENTRWITVQLDPRDQQWNDLGLISDIHALVRIGMFTKGYTRAHHPMQGWVVSFPYQADDTQWFQGVLKQIDRFREDIIVDCIYIDRAYLFRGMPSNLA